MNMRIPRLLAFAAITLLSDANASEHRCWLNRITAEEGGIRIAIDATPELRFRFNGKYFSFQVSNAELGASSAGGLDKSNGILLKSGDRLEIYTSSSNIQRCVIEPVIGPEFSGVSLESWGASKGEPTPFVLARTVRADRE